MDAPYWQRQTLEKPLFPNLIWSRPENRHHAGKLLIVGGNAQGFATPAEAYAEAGRAGIGSARVLLPDVLRRTVGKVFIEGEFAPSTPSGSFARTALSEALAMADWSDGVILAGDLGRNSETAILIEQFATKYRGLLTLTRDAADYCLSETGTCYARPDTTLVISMAQLQRLGRQAHFTTAFRFDMDLVYLIDALHEFSEQFPVNLIVKHHTSLIVASQGNITSTTLADERAMWRLKTAVHAAVWWLQHPQQPFAALATATLYPT